MAFKTENRKIEWTENDFLPTKLEYLHQNNKKGSNIQHRVYLSIFYSLVHIENNFQCIESSKILKAHLSKCLSAFHVKNIL